MQPFPKISNGFYRHPQTHSETHYLQIEKKERIKKLAATEAVRRVSKVRGMLLQSKVSEIVAIALPTNSIVTDSGEVLARMKLITPQRETRIVVPKLTEAWEAIDEDEFMECWDTQMEDMPNFKTEMLHLVSGILLPIWKSIPPENSRVYRLKTDEGAKVLGRLIQAKHIRKVFAAMGIERPFNAAEAIHNVLDQGETEALGAGVNLRRSRIAGSDRLELTDCQPFFDQLVAVGCFSEIIQWRKRIFIPTGQKAPEVLERVISLLG